MSCKLIYKDVAPGAETDAAVTTTDAQSICTPASLPTADALAPIVTGEPNLWKLDGTYQILDSQVIPFWSNAMSDASGAFTIAPAITVSFDSNYTTLGISLIFSPNTGDWCDSVTITWYQGTTQLAQETFTPDAASYFCGKTVTAFNKVTFVFNHTNKGRRYVKLSSIIFGIVREFDRSEMGNVSILQEADPISASLSINYLDWTLKSKTGVDYIFQLKQPIEAYNGDSLIGVFYVDKIPDRTGENDYTIECQDAIGVLDGDAFPATMYASATLVSTVIASIVGNAFEVELDSSFASTTVKGLIQGGTKRSALQQLAFAIGAVVDTSGTDKIKIYPAVYSNPEIIENTRLYVGGSVAQDAIVTAVAVTYHTYTTGSGSSGDEVIDVNGTKYVHTTGTVMINNPNVTASDKANVKSVTDCRLVNADNANAVAQRVYNYWMKRNTIRASIVHAGENPMDYITVPTAWGSIMTGSIVSIKLKLSNTTAADLEVLGS